MASEPKKTSELDPITRLRATDQVLVLSSSGGSNSTGRVALSSLAGNSSLIPLIDTPESSTSLNVPSGAILTDGEYLYLATEDGVLARIALESF